MQIKEKLCEAQDIINRELQKQGLNRIYAITCEQIPQDRATQTHRLVVFGDEEKSIFNFTEYELLENYGSKQWEKSLRDYVSDILTDF